METNEDTYSASFISGSNSNSKLAKNLNDSQIKNNSLKFLKLPTKTSIGGSQLY